MAQELGVDILTSEDLNHKETEIHLRLLHWSRQPQWVSEVVSVSGMPGGREAARCQKTQAVRIGKNGADAEGIYTERSKQVVNTMNASTKMRRKTTELMGTDHVSRERICR